jgi:ParB/RepB/Spo0J family partition protein
MKPQTKVADAPTGLQVQEIDLAKIVEPDHAAREEMNDEKLAELAESMATVGLIQPIILKTIEGGFEIVAGHRRFCAAQRLHWEKIPAIVRADDGVPFEAMKLHENLNREELTVAEEAIFFAELQEAMGWDFETLCHQVRKSEDYVGSRLRVLSEDPQVFQALRNREIAFGVAKVLNQFDNEQMRRYFLQCAIRDGAPERLVKKWLADWRAQQMPAQPVAAHVEPTVTDEPIMAHKAHCQFCGGDKDPWNLVVIQVHVWELDRIMKILREPPQEGE